MSAPPINLKQQLYSQLRIGEKQLRELFTGVVSRRRGHPKRGMRRDTRFYFPSVTAVMTMIEHMTDRREVLCVPIDLCGQGVGMLCTTYIHPGSRVRVPLTTHDGETLLMEGTAQWCYLVAMPIHELGIRFSQPVDPGDFLEIPRAETQADDGDEPPGADSAELERLGRSTDPYDRLEAGGLELAASARRRDPTDKVMSIVRQLDRLSKQLKL